MSERGVAMVLEGLRHARSDAVTVSAIVLDTCVKDLPYEWLGDPWE